MFAGGMFVYLLCIGFQNRMLGERSVIINCLIRMWLLYIFIVLTYM